MYKINLKECLEEAEKAINGDLYEEVEAYEYLQNEDFYISNGGANGCGFSAYYKTNLVDVKELISDEDYNFLFERLEDEIDYCDGVIEDVDVTIRISDHFNNPAEINFVLDKKFNKFAKSICGEHIDLV